jgi:hypothetical protein
MFDERFTIRTRSVGAWVRSIQVPGQGSSTQSTSTRLSAGTSSGVSSACMSGVSSPGTSVPVSPFPLSPSQAALPSMKKTAARTVRAPAEPALIRREKSCMDILLEPVAKVLYVHSLHSLFQVFFNLFVQVAVRAQTPEVHPITARAAPLMAMKMAAAFRSVTLSFRNMAAKTATKMSVSWLSTAATLEYSVYFHPTSHTSMDR